MKLPAVTLLLLGIALPALATTHDAAPYSTVAEARAAAAQAAERLKSANRNLETVLARHAANNAQARAAQEELQQITTERTQAQRALDAARATARQVAAVTPGAPPEEPAPEKLVETAATDTEKLTQSLKDLEVRVKATQQQLDRLKGIYLGLTVEAARAYDQQEKARFEQCHAKLWAEFLANPPAEEPREAEPGAPEPATEINAATFGLGAHNRQTSAYNALRMYRTNGSVQTLPAEGPIERPETIKFCRHHHGIDYSSRDEKGRVARLPFKPGFAGLARYVGGSCATIEVALPNGNRLLFLHASRAADIVRSARTPVPVTADTVIGYTGSTGSGAVHLHVEARDPAGRSIPLEIAVLPAEDPRAQLFQQARAEAEAPAARPEEPKLAWAPSDAVQAASSARSNFLQGGSTTSRGAKSGSTRKRRR